MLYGKDPTLYPDSGHKGDKEEDHHQKGESPLSVGMEGKAEEGISG